MTPEYLFSNALRKARAKAGLTQKELADKLYISQQGLNRWENGECLPRLDRIKDLMEILDIDIYEMIFGPNDTWKDDLIKLAEEENLSLSFVKAIRDLPDDTLTLWRYDKRYPEWLRLKLLEIRTTLEK